MECSHHVKSWTNYKKLDILNKHHAMRPNSIVGSCWVLCGPTLQKMHDVSTWQNLPHNSSTSHKNLFPPPLFALTITLLPPLLWTTYLPTIHLVAPLTYSHASLCLSLSLSLSLRDEGTYFASSQGFLCQGIFGIRVFLYIYI